MQTRNDHVTEYISVNTANVPDERGYFGEFGGRFVPETLIPALDELLAAYQEAMADRNFSSGWRPSRRPTPDARRRSATPNA